MPSCQSIIMRFLAQVLALIFFGVAVKADEPYQQRGKDEIVFYACNLEIGYTATFCEASAVAAYDYAYTCFGSNPYARATLAGCLAHSNHLNRKALSNVFEACEKYNVSTSWEDFEEAYKNYTKYAKPTSEIEGFNFSVPVDVPVKLDNATTDLYKDAYLQFLGNYDNSLYYGSGLLGYWLLVFLIFSIVNWSKTLFPNVVKKFVGPVTDSFRKYVTLPAVRRRRTNEKPLLKFFDLLVPSRLETLLLTLFVGLTIFVCAHDIKYIENDPVFGSRFAALLRYTADRTGIVASVNMPLLILFAGRNNCLQWLTKWNFATFIAFHRWVARVIFSLVVTHAICFTMNFWDDYKESVKETYFFWGIIATVAGGVIMFQGMLFLRRRWYEFFLIVHIIFAALFIGGAWLHVVDLGYVWFYYATVAVWVFDRVIRISRLIWFGCPQADVHLLADETLKVVVPKPKHWSSIPGGHAFIHFLRPSCFWQSHPFTFTESIDAGKSIILYCKVKGGVTHGLYQYLVTHPGKTAKIRVALEGPYGESTSAYKYDNAVFVAGGNGIPGIYSEAFDLAQRSPDNEKQTLKLIWVIREYKSLLWFYDELLELKNSRLQTTIYVTRPEEELQSTELKLSEGLGEKLEKSEIVFTKELKTPDTSQLKHELSHIEFKEVRPCVDDIVKQEVLESAGSTAFVTCGHPIMVDDLRYSVAQSMGKTDGKRVDFFEQLQVWA